MLAKLAYRYRRIAKLVSFGLHALGTGPQRDEWEVSNCRSTCCCCLLPCAGCFMLGLARHRLPLVLRWWCPAMQSGADLQAGWPVL
jgi:hypothetical protein